MTMPEGDTGPIFAGTAAYRKFCIALVIAGLSTFSLLYNVQSLLPIFANTFHVSAGEASLAVSLATGPLAFVLIVASVVSDRIGRRQIMLFSLYSASTLTIASAILPGWHTLLVTRFLMGIALGGIPASAMAYIAEEVDASAIGRAMGVYIGGSAMGGMLGRIAVSYLADRFDWRIAIGTMGAVSLIGALIFQRAAPPSRAFKVRKHDWASFIGAVKYLAQDKALPWLYAEGFLIMGTLVTIYNYVTFYLLAPPYRLSQTAVGAIFLFYIVGSFSSTWFGTLAGRLGRRRVFWIPIGALLLGVALTATRPLALIILGVGIVTVGYFGAHSIASSWVGRRGRSASGQAAAFYLFFVYLGSSVVGSTAGIAWSHAGWPGVAGYTGALIVLALLIGLRLVAVKPLPENEKPSRPAPA
jgi:MFS transporter, YNFM family, putative membrane transport protein